LRVRLKFSRLRRSPLRREEGRGNFRTQYLERAMKSFVIVGFFGLIALTGCSTVAGVGKDVSAVGRGITHVAGEVRDEVFTGGDKPRYVETRYRSQSAARPSVIVKEPCDPNAGELRGGSGLPPCPRVYYRD